MPKRLQSSSYKEHPEPMREIPSPETDDIDGFCEKDIPIIEWQEQDFVTLEPYASPIPKEEDTTDQKTKTTNQEVDLMIPEDSIIRSKFNSKQIKMFENYTFSHGLEVLSEEEQIICEGGIGYTPTPMLPIYFMGEFLRGLVSGFKKGYEDAKEFEDNIIYA